MQARPVHDAGQDGQRDQCRLNWAPLDLVKCEPGQHEQGREHEKYLAKLSYRGARATTNPMSGRTHQAMDKIRSCGHRYASELSRSLRRPRPR